MAHDGGQEETPRGSRPLLVPAGTAGTRGSRGEGVDDALAIADGEPWSAFGPPSSVIPSPSTRRSGRLPGPARGPGRLGLGVVLEGEPGARVGVEGDASGSRRCLEVD